MTAQQEPEHCGHKGPVFEEQKKPRGYCDNTFLGKKCIHSSSEYYCIEDGNDCDSGFNYYCNHPSVGKKKTPAHHGEVPDWCPCEHDTRSRHAPTPEAPETKQAYRNGFEEGFEIGKAQCETHHEDMKAEVAAKARGEVLDKLREWSIVQYEISGVIDTMTLKQKIESLRTGGDPR